MFEVERDEATRTAETLAKTSVKLLDMLDLLEKLAVEKVEDGDEEGARSILKEKQEVQLMMDKTNTRAKNNFALAAKLAQAVGQKQAELLTLLPSGRENGASAALPQAEAAAGPAFEDGPRLPASSRAQWEKSLEAAQARLRAAEEAANPAAPPPPKPTIRAKWEDSLEQAQARLREAEQMADTEARLANLGAEQSISSAMSRIQARQRDIMEHRQRIKLSAEQSIAEARERLRKQEEEALEEVKWLVRRYREGEYIPDYQLDSAFSKLQRRMYK